MYGLDKVLSVRSAMAETICATEKSCTQDVSSHMQEGRRQLSDGTKCKQTIIIRAASQENQCGDADNHRSKGSGMRVKRTLFIPCQNKMMYRGI